LGKQFILTAHKATPPQFYPSEYNVLYYNNATDLEKRLTSTLRSLLVTD
ncbi:MAG: hypothetical protein QOJ16_4372, partial [Acidobacteriota bacterium]|nr:hypothetical protein [Acidobacteriota bacterium]